MVSQIPCRRHIWQPRILIGSFYSALPAKAGTQIGTVGWIPNIRAFTRVSTRYARE